MKFECSFVRSSHQKCPRPSTGHQQWQDDRHAAHKHTQMPGVSQLSTHNPRMTENAAHIRERLNLMVGILAAALAYRSFSLAIILRPCFSSRCAACGRDDRERRRRKENWFSTGPRDRFHELQGEKERECARNRNEQHEMAAIHAHLTPKKHGNARGQTHALSVSSTKRGRKHTHTLKYTVPSAL